MYSIKLSMKRGLKLKKCRREDKNGFTKVLVYIIFDFKAYRTIIVGRSARM